MESQENNTLKTAMDLFGKYRLPTKTKIVNKRQWWVKQFADELNAERTGKYKKLNPSFVAFKMGHLKIPDLESFYSQCKDYKMRGNSFSKCWWGSLKPKSYPQQRI